MIKIKYHYKRATVGPPAKRHFAGRFDDDPILNASLVALLFFKGFGHVLLKNPIFL